MELTVNPEGMFRLDFDAILDGARRQETIQPSNKGEYAIASTAHFFFDSHVLRLIRKNEWVFESARVFAEEYSNDCFRYLRTASVEIYRVQKKLKSINDRVKALVDRIAEEGAIKTTGTLNLVKASDFYEVVELSYKSSKNGYCKVEVPDLGRYEILYLAQGRKNFILDIEKNIVKDFPSVQPFKMVLTSDR